MRRQTRPPNEQRRELLELTCVVDGQTHLVPIDAFALAATAAEIAFPAVCGHPVTAGSMSAPPGPECRPCQQNPGPAGRNGHVDRNGRVRLW